MSRPSLNKGARRPSLIYRKHAMRLAQWQSHNLAEHGWPRRSMDDDMAMAVALLFAAAQMAEAVEKRK